MQQRYKIVLFLMTIFLSQVTLVASIICSNGDISDYLAFTDYFEFLKIEEVKLAIDFQVYYKVNDTEGKIEFISLEFMEDFISRHRSCWKVSIAKKDYEIDFLYSKNIEIQTNKIGNFIRGNKLEKYHKFTKTEYGIALYKMSVLKNFENPVIFQFGMYEQFVDNSIFNIGDEFTVTENIHFAKCDMPSIVTSFGQTIDKGSTLYVKNIELKEERMLVHVKYGNRTCQISAAHLQSCTKRIKVGIKYQINRQVPTTESQISLLDEVKNISLCWEKFGITKSLVDHAFVAVEINSSNTDYSTIIYIEFFGVDDKNLNGTINVTIAYKRKDNFNICWRNEKDHSSYVAGPYVYHDKNINYKDLTPRDMTLANVLETTLHWNGKYVYDKYNCIDFAYYIKQEIQKNLKMSGKKNLRSKLDDAVNSYNYILRKKTYRQAWNVILSVIDSSIDSFANTNAAGEKSLTVNLVKFIGGNNNESENEKAENNESESEESESSTDNVLTRQNAKMFRSNIYDNESENEESEIKENSVDVKSKESLSIIDVTSEESLPINTEKDDDSEDDDSEEDVFAKVVFAKFDDSEDDVFAKVVFAKFDDSEDDVLAKVDSEEDVFAKVVFAKFDDSEDDVLTKVVLTKVDDSEEDELVLTKVDDSKTSNNESKNEESEIDVKSKESLSIIDVKSKESLPIIDVTSKESLPISKRQKKKEKNKKKTKKEESCGEFKINKEWLCEKLGGWDDEHINIKIKIGSKTIDEETQNKNEETQNKMIQKVCCKSKQVIVKDREDVVKQRNDNVVKGEKDVVKDEKDVVKGAKNSVVKGEKDVVNGIENDVVNDIQSGGD